MDLLDLWIVSIVRQDLEERHTASVRKGTAMTEYGAEIKLERSR